MLANKLNSVIAEFNQSEQPWPIPRNSVESDHGCTSWIYFNNAGDKVTLTLYNHVDTITSVIAAKRLVINEVYIYINFIYSAD